MYKKWWFGNDLSTPFTGNEDYNRIEATVGSDPVNPLTFNRVFENLFSNDEELRNFVTMLNTNKSLPNGVVKNAGNNFLVDESCIEKVSESSNSDSTISYNAFIAPKGIYLKNGNLYSLSDNYFLATRQLCAALRIDPVSKDENVYLHWGVVQEANDNEDIPEIQGYICEIRKQGTDGVFIEKTFKDPDPINLLLKIAGRNQGVADVTFFNYISRYFVDGLGNFNPRFFKLREIFIIEPGNSYFFGIKNKQIVLELITHVDQVFSTDDDDVLICKFFVEYSNDSWVLSFEDHREFIPTVNGFGNQIVLNSYTSTDDTHDLSTVENPITDNSLNYANIENNNGFVTFLSKTRATENDPYVSNNAVFGYIQPESSINKVYEIAGATDTKGADSFILNKDIMVKTFPEQQPGQAQYQSLVSFMNRSGAFPQAASFQNLDEYVVTTELSNYPPVFFVKDDNTFYGWLVIREDGPNSILKWIPVENPFVQPYNLNITTDLNNPSDISTMTFAEFKTRFDNNNANRLNLKNDGTNFYVFADGNFIPFTSDGVTLTFSPAIPANTQKLTCVAVKGGEQYRAAYSIVQAGTGAGSGEPHYTGSLSKYSITSKVEALPDKINVFVNGSLKNEAPMIVSAKITGYTSIVGLLTNVITLDVPTSSYEDGDYIIDTTIHKIFILKKNETATYIVSFDGSTVDGINVDDKCEIYRKGIYDYFIEKDNNSIIFFEPLGTGDVVRIEDRVSVVSNMDINTSGDIFPSNPLFGMEFYLRSSITETEANQYSLNDEVNTFTEGWYKYNGFSWISIG